MSRLVIDDDRLARLRMAIILSSLYPYVGGHTSLRALHHAVFELRLALFGMVIHPTPMLPDDELLRGDVQRYVRGLGHDVLRPHAVDLFRAWDGRPMPARLRPFEAVLMRLRRMLWPRPRAPRRALWADEVAALEMRAALAQYGEERGLGPLECVVRLGTLAGGNGYQVLRGLLEDAEILGRDPIELFCEHQLESHGQLLPVPVRRGRR